jgi:hypothetical protein
VVEIRTAALEEANDGYVLHWTETNTLAMYFKSEKEHAKMRNQEKKGKRAAENREKGMFVMMRTRGQMLVEEKERESKLPATVVSAVALAVTLLYMEMTAMEMAVGDLISNLVLAVYFLGS